MTNQHKPAPKAADPQESAQAPSRPDAGVESAKPVRTLTINGETFPIAFSKYNPGTGQVYDYVKKSKPVEARVLNEATGVYERRMVEATFYVKKARPGTGPSADQSRGLLDYKD